MTAKAMVLWVILTAGAAAAKEASSADRRAILDAVRPAAAAQARQAVRIQVDRINEDAGWSVVVGSLVSPSGADLDWSRALGCNPDLDKMLWAVLQKTAKGWRVKQLQICAPEPPYWYLAQDSGLTWPCGVYAGLENGSDGDMEAQCRQAQGWSAGKPRLP